ncbi:MAG: glutathione peroxidase [Halieaceae bacterium]|nr:glutathione peroxidase [Halieaceae bacterium]
MTDSVYDFSCKTAAGDELSLEEYRGNTLLIVNTASKCGFTPQYAGLEKLYQKYKERGLLVLGFPCNQFGRQEPGSDSEILEFGQQKYDVSFPMFSKIEVNGSKTSPLYDYLKKAAPGALGSRRIKWNFTKFLVSDTGRVIRRFAPATTPEQLESELEELLPG